MKTILRIARLELSTLFYSPVAWLVLMIFPIQAGLDLTKFLQMLGRAHRMGQEFKEVTGQVFGTQYGFYAGVKNTLYLYIPLLTMGLISREIHSGSIKLLLSSPIKVIDIVLGKYLAISWYALFLLAILGLFGLAGAWSITHMDYKIVISGAIGLYLLICAYASIGLFMSSLTSYQVVAAISTLAVLGVLNFVGGLFQGVDAVRHITYFLSISGRTEQFINGLISTEDVIYFILVIVLFLSLTGIRLQSSREAKPLSVKLLRYALLIGFCCLIGYISSRPQLTGYLDMTMTKNRTLNANSVAIIKKMDKPLKITTYINLLDDNYYLAKPESKSADEKYFMQYRRFMPDLTMEYVYYYDKSQNVNLYKNNPGLSDEAIARKVADIQGVAFEDVLNPAQIRKGVDLSTEENRLVRQLQYGDRTTFLRYFSDMMIYPSEQEITAAIKRLVEPEKIPVVTFLTGNEERSKDRAGDADYKTATGELTFRYSLVNQGFDVDTTSLQAGEIPAATSTLVIADPKIKFTATELQKINNYIARGGNLLLAVEPGRQSIMNPLIQNLGVTASGDTIIERSRDYAPDFLLTTFTAQAAEKYKRYRVLKQDSGLVSTPGATVLNYTTKSGFQVIPILQDRKGSAVAVTLTRKLSGKEQRIMITGDADFMSSAALYRQRPETKNFDFMTEMFSWFCYGEFPVDTYRPKSRDVIKGDETALLVTRIFFFGILPGAVLIAGASLLIYRKRR
ncbi:Gldg family protein [Pedobacter deserti]|uniref:Gldg family protein n=1 Tax=Pedobacter deserti TaxID=2817382 RepID=UPI0021093564|nr:Gldg family protein [Pedobacter sp. SYSU D00382]